MSIEMSRQCAEKIMVLPKYLDANLVWEAKSNNLGVDLISEQLYDDTGATIPGLTMRLERKREILIQGRCRWEFGLFQLDIGRKWRVYQLHVSPGDKRTHNNENGGIFGPHEHIGNITIPVTRLGINCQNFENAFKMFCERVNLTFTGDQHELLLA